jgi:hypothetical protein
MMYLRRMIDRARPGEARLVARRRPLFAELETRIEERDVDAIVGATTHVARATSPANDAPPNVRRDDPPPDAPPVARVRPPEFAAHDDRALRDADAVLAHENEETLRPPDRRAPNGAVERERIVHRRRVELLGEGDGNGDAPLLPELHDEPRSSLLRPAAPLDAPIRDAPPLLRGDERVGSTTVVNVAIGRIDVRAAVAPATPAKPEPFRPRLSLDAYLAGREGAR